MPFDVNGNFSLVPGTIVSDGMTIQPSQHNPPFQDVANGLSQTVLRDGRAPWTGDQNANGHKVTNAADGYADSDLATVGQAGWKIGDFKDSARVLDSKWLRRDGSIYSTGMYPELSLLMEQVDGRAIFTELESNVTFNIRDIAYGNGRWIGTTIGDTGIRTVISTDRVNWRGVDPLFSHYLNKITFANGIFASTLFDGNVGTTSTGEQGAWTLRSVPEGRVGPLSSLAHDGSAWVYVARQGQGETGAGTILRSTDLMTWTNVAPSSFGLLLERIVYGNGLFVAGGAQAPGGNFAVSPDGITWQAGQVSNGLIRSLSFAGGYFWASTGIFLYRSEDGLSWDGITTGASSQINGVAYGNGNYILVCDDGSVFASVDGLSWAKQNSPYNVTLNKVIYDPADGKFLIVGQGGLISLVEFERSPLFKVPNDNPTYGWIKAL